MLTQISETLVRRRFICLENEVNLLKPSIIDTLNEEITGVISNDKQKYCPQKKLVLKRKIDGRRQRDANTIDKNDKMIENTTTKKIE